MTEISWPSYSNLKRAYYISFYTTNPFIIVLGLSFMSRAPTRFVIASFKVY
jgi:glycerol dehydrogenase-like iron-containing ADH family enzyme